MPKYAKKLPVAMHPEKLPVAGSVGGRLMYISIAYRT